MVEEIIEEIKTDSNSDAVVSNNEIDAVTKKVLAEGKIEKDKMAVNIETQIRAKIEAENHLKDLEKQNQQFKESIQRQEAEKQRISADKDKEIETLKSQVGGSKAQVQTQSPFGKRDGEQTDVLSTMKNLTQEQINEIGENSRLAFMKEQNIPDSQWKNK